MRAFPPQHFLPRKGGDIQLVPRQIHRKSGRGCIANRQPCAGGGDGIAVGQAAARGGAVPCKDNVAVKIHGREIDDLAIGCDLDLGLQLKLLDHIGHPAFAKAFPCQHFHWPRAKQRPQGHFHSAGVRCRYDANAVIGWHAQNFTGEINRLGEFGFAYGCAVRAA